MMSPMLIDRWLVGLLYVVDYMSIQIYNFLWIEFVVNFIHLLDTVVGF